MQSIANLTLDSREVAKMVEKQHCHLVRDIAKYVDVLMTESKNGLSDFFKNSTYKDSSGKVNKCYLLTRKGCEFVANKMTGKKGILFTANYINRFHEMEKELMKNQAAKQEKKPDYDKLGFYEIPMHVNRLITNAVEGCREAHACFEVVESLLPPKYAEPIKCLVRRYGQLMHYYQNCEDRALEECGYDNFHRYAAHYEGYLDFCEKSKK